MDSASLLYLKDIPTARREEIPGQHISAEGRSPGCGFGGFRHSVVLHLQEAAAEWRRRIQHRGSSLSTLETSRLYLAALSPAFFCENYNFELSRTKDRLWPKLWSLLISTFIDCNALAKPLFRAHYIIFARIDPHLSDQQGHVDFASIHVLFLWEMSLISLSRKNAEYMLLLLCTVWMLSLCD